MGSPRTFVSSEHDYGNLYTWEEAQNVCPAGWRLPSYDELYNLINRNFETTTIYGVTGNLLGYGNNTIFLPAAGYLYSAGNIVENGKRNQHGWYWTTPSPSRTYGSTSSVRFIVRGVEGQGIYPEENGGRGSFSVRCVCEQE